MANAFEVIWVQRWDSGGYSISQEPSDMCLSVTAWTEMHGTSTSAIIMVDSADRLDHRGIC